MWPTILDIVWVLLDGDGPSSLVQVSLTGTGCLSRLSRVSLAVDKRPLSLILLSMASQRVFHDVVVPSIQQAVQGGVVIKFWKKKIHKYVVTIHK